MTLPMERDVATPAEPGRPAPSERRTIVLVAGSGRSGTSLFTGIMQRLGFHVPQPEVVADPANPRGYAESKWAVDFHIRLLERAGVLVADARPSAWAHTARVGLDEGAQRQLRSWLADQFGKADHIIIKEPRLSWFLPLWRRSAEEIGASPKVVSVLRHPAAVIDSKQRSYGDWHGDVERTAGWVNQVLFTERATREAPRFFVKYKNLLDDWTREIARAGELLDLSVIRDVPAPAIVQTHEFVDHALSRSRETWDEFEIPDGLRGIADEVWELMSRLAEEGADGDEALTERLDAARAAYIRLYEDAEAIAQSSITAAWRDAGGRESRLVGLARRVPKHYRRKLPLRWRMTVARALARRGS
jgi:hypothetical protein